MSPTVNEQVMTMTNTNPTMWKVNMNVVIVLIVALINLLPKYSVKKYFPDPVAASPSVNPYSFPVSGYETDLCAAADIKTEQSLTELIKSQGFCWTNQVPCLTGQSVVQV